jgi:His-Xaa-Ser system protein HxsD
MCGSREIVMNPPAFGQSEGTVDVTVDLRNYRLAAVKKTAYRLADKCTVTFGVIDGDCLPLKFSFRATFTPSSRDEVMRLFFQDLLDQELREDIAAETAALRHLILAHAFSRTDLIQRPDK